MLRYHDMKPRLSIIVPVYNASPYIGHCLETISRQGLSPDDYEVIMVDDGSTDDSLDLCRKLSDERNVKILHRENGGAGRARNAGIAEARGEYVYCLDVDDGLEDGSLSILLGQCFDQNLDAVFFGALVEYASEEVKTSDPQDDRYFERRQSPRVRTGEELLVEQQQTRNFCAQPCMHIARRQLLVDNDIRFAEGIVNEDNLYVFHTTIHSQRANVDPHPYYRYVVRPHSVTTETRGTLRQFDAHFYLAREFYRDYLAAIDQGKDNLAWAIWTLIDWYLEVAVDALISADSRMEKPTASDPVSLSVYHRLFERILDEREARLAAESQARALEQQLAKTGLRRAAEALFRKTKRASGGHR